MLLCDKRMVAYAARTHSTKGGLPCPRRIEQDGTRFHHTTWSGIQFKTHELLIYGIFHLIFLDCGWSWVIKIAESKTKDWVVVIEGVGTVVHENREKVHVKILASHITSSRLLWKLVEGKTLNIGKLAKKIQVQRSYVWPPLSSIQV